MKKSRSFRKNAALGSLVLALVGCAHAPSTPSVAPPAATRVPIPEQVRAQLGLIGVVSAEYVPTLEITTPERFSTGGAAAGLAKGFGIGLLGAAGCFFSMGLLAEACFLALGTPVWMVKGAEEGARKMEPPPEVAHNVSPLQSSLVEVPVQHVLRDRIIDLARAQDRHSLLRLTEVGPHSPYDAIDYGRWAGEGIDTILEVRLESVVLRQEVDPSSLVHGVPGSGGADPPFPLLVRAKTRLIRAADGVELDARLFEDRRAGYPIALWAADDAQRFRDALDAAVHALAREILRKLFLDLRFQGDDHRW